MNKKALLILLVCFVVGLLLSLPVSAQGPEVEIIPISGTYSYVWELLHMVETDGFVLIHAREDEVWKGDLEGTAEAEYRLEYYNTTPPITRTGFLIEFTGTLLGEHEGTLTIILTDPDNPNPNLGESNWERLFCGEWEIVSGTGELANVHGHGVWLGPSNSANDPDHDVPDIAWQGEVMFMEAPE